LVLKLRTLAMIWLRCSTVIVSAIVAKDSAVGPGEGRREAGCVQTFILNSVAFLCSRTLS
jgi:hypothetical protein